MKSRLWFYALIILNISIFGVFIYQYAYADYPMVGHDYRLFISRLIDTHLHYKVEGLSIQWYTPSFGGGLPAYANPLQAQFSLPQLLTWFTNPWDAVIISSIIFALIGFLAVYYFLKDALELSQHAAILGAVFFITNGFFIERVIIGHVNFITFPLISIFILACLHPKLSPLIAGCLLSIASAIMIYSGGVYIGVIGFFSALIIFPIVFLLKPSLFSFRRFISIGFWGFLLTLLLCGSKINATSIYMTNFPREVKDEYSVNWITGFGGMIFQLIGVMTTTPILYLIGKNGMVLVARLGEWSGIPYGFWELDSSISPVLLLILALGTWKLLKRKPQNSFSWKNISAICILIAGIILVTQFSIAKGPFFEILRSLPVLKSLHANTRFTSSFILPLAILGAKIYDQWVKKREGKTYSRMIFLALNGLSLACLWVYFLLPLEVQARTCYLPIFNETYELIKAGETMPVDKIIPEMNDYEVFLAGASNTVRHYEPLFRDNNEAFHPVIHEGSVFDVEDGYYNMTNPTGYLFPEENGTSIYERFHISDYNSFILFLNRHQPDWKISSIQKFLDWAGLLTFITLCIIIIVFVTSRIIFPKLIYFAIKKK